MRGVSDTRCVSNLDAQLKETLYALVNLKKNESKEVEGVSNASKSIAIDLRE